ncbi:unnamed protein product [Polarella glacialis]|uniref:PPM-type phosphatase domain-containing protein n=1 Tax=Polarella glacialis TaxID=89957 RepID=A0A813EGJ2_POLGL|nr:unnamed protein product [Polarella glacialis]
MYPRGIQIGVSTKMESAAQPSFQAKALIVYGVASQEILADEYYMAMRSLKGHVPAWRRPNQDECFYLSTKDGFRFCGVFDGHGSDGHQAAALVRDFFLRRLPAEVPVQRPARTEEYRKTMRAVLSGAFRDADALLLGGGEGVDARMSGATANVCIYDTKKRWLFTAWAGDCRCTCGFSKDFSCGSDASGDGSNNNNNTDNNNNSNNNSNNTNNNNNNNNDHGSQSSNNINNNINNNNNNNNTNNYNNNNNSNNNNNNNNTNNNNNHTNNNSTNGSDHGSQSSKGQQSKASSRRNRKKKKRKIMTLRLSDDHTLAGADERATESGSQATGSGPAGAAEVVAQAPATKAAAKAPASAHADLPPEKVQKTGQGVAMPK